MKRLIAAILLVTSTAFATSDAEKERARKLFDEGNAAIDTGKYVDALEKFRGAYAIWPNAKILLNIATTLRALGRNAEAADAYEQYISAPDADPKKRDEVKGILETLDKTVGKLRLKPATKMRVLVDGRLIGDTDGILTVRVEPGVHVVVCETTTAFNQTISVAAGEVRTVELKTAEPEAKTAAPVSSSVVDQPTKLIPEPPEPRRYAIMARADVDATFRGAVGALGVGYRWDRVEVGAAALLGARRGAEPYAALFITDRTVRPVIFAALPLFFVEGARVGARGGVGVHIDATATTTLFAHATAAHFFAPPAGFSSTYGLLTLGAELRF
jgi:hypothetical protein